MTRAGLQPRTAARRLSALRQYYRFLYGEGLRGDDPTASVDSPRLGRPLPKILSEDEVDRLLTQARQRPGLEGARLVAILELLYATGLRVSELAGLPLSAAFRDPRVLIVAASRYVIAVATAWSPEATAREPNAHGPLAAASGYFFSDPLTWFCCTHSAVHCLFPESTSCAHTF